MIIPDVDDVARCTIGLDAIGTDVIDMEAVIVISIKASAIGVVETVRVRTPRVGANHVILVSLGLAYETPVPIITFEVFAIGVKAVVVPVISSYFPVVTIATLAVIETVRCQLRWLTISHQAVDFALSHSLEDAVINHCCHVAACRSRYRKGEIAAEKMVSGYIFFALR